MKIVIATGNQGKLREISQLLTNFDCEICSQADFDTPEAIEDGLSFVENSLIKARNAAQHTRLAAIADDSGIVVDALNGQPGIYSARYAGENCSDTDNVEKLLRALKNKPQRAARFFCAMTFVRHADDPTPVIATASWEGVITEESFGAGGFGYDPVFQPRGHNCTAAELDKSEKNAISHRGQALQKLLTELKAQGCVG